jgi:hypothetical protein
MMRQQNFQTEIDEELTLKALGVPDFEVDYLRHMKEKREAAKKWN